MCDQTQKGFCYIFDGILQHQKGYLVYVPSTRNIISLYDVVLDESFSSALAYTPGPYSEVMAMCPSVVYTPYYISTKKQNDNIITFTQFEEGNILTKICNDEESGEASVPPLLSKEEIDAMDYGDESDHDLIYTEIFKTIRDRIQSHPNVN